MSDKYILRGHEAIPVDDVLTWAMWFEAHVAERIVKQEDISGWLVSTVFLGLDYPRRGGEPPLLFETMAFKPSPDCDTQTTLRCSTWEEAEAQHESVASRIRKAVNG